MPPVSVTFVGNCQSEALATFYREFCVTDAEAEVAYIDILLLAEDSAERARSLRRLSHTQVLVQQVFDWPRPAASGSAFPTPLFGRYGPTLAFRTHEITKRPRWPVSMFPIRPSMATPSSTVLSRQECRLPKAFAATWSSTLSSAPTCRAASKKKWTCWTSAIA
jgi:hypothetical protein